MDNFTTTDLSLVTYICMKGYKVLEILPVMGSNTALKFLLNCSKNEGDKLQDEFIQSEFRTYYSTFQQVKYLLRSYKERRSS